MSRTLVCLALLVVVTSGCEKQKPVGDSEQENRPPASSLMDLLDDPPGIQDDRVVEAQFVDIARPAGIDFLFHHDTVANRYFLPEIMGGGIGWLDFDRDGNLDIYLAQGNYLETPATGPGDWRNALYRGLGTGRFAQVDQSGGAEDDGYGQGVAVGDFDADGFPDLFVANFGANRLYHNQGDGSFLDVTERSGLDGQVWSSSPMWLDIDRDGDLDLFVTNYLDVRADNIKKMQYGGRPGYAGPGQYAAIDDQVYLNEGDGRFVEAAGDVGLNAPNGKGLATTAIDFDLDGRAEIYVANDMMPNFLYSSRNPFTDSAENAASGEEDTDGDSQASASPRPDESRSGATYVELASVSGSGSGETGQPEASMGIACGDFDQDGLPDIFLTHYFSHKNTLYRNLGNLLFMDDSQETGIARASFDTLGFGTVPLDYDHDGSLDLFIANGHVLGPEQQPFEMSPQLMRNDGRGSFDDVSQSSGPYFQGKYLGRGAAGADFDDDGDCDIAVSHVKEPFALLENRTDSPNHYLGVELVTPDRMVPVGSRIELTVDGRLRRFPIVAGGSYLCSSDPRLSIGLGGDERPVDVTVVWSDGTKETFPGLGVDRYWQLSPGGGAVDRSQLPE